MTTTTHMQKIARESSIFAVAFTTSFAQNMFVRWALGEKEFKKVLTKAANEAIVEDCKESWKEDDECVERIKRNPMNYDIVKLRSSFNAFRYSFASWGTILLPLFGGYYAWDTYTPVKAQFKNAQGRLAPALTFAIVLTLIHQGIQTVGRPRTRGEVAMYSAGFALLAAGLSAMMHEFYPETK